MIRDPRHHHEHHPGGYASEVRAVRRVEDDGDAAGVIIRRRRGHEPEFVRETVVEDEYQPGRSHRDQERRGVAVSRRRALSVEHDRRGRVAGYYSSRYSEDPRRSLGSVARRDAYYDEEYELDRHPRRRSASRNEKLAAGAAGAGLAIAGKEYWDHRVGHPRSPIETAAAGVAGAVAGAEAVKYYERSRGHGSRSPSPNGYHHHRKSLGEAALAAVGLGEAARHHSRSRSRSRGGSHRYRSGSSDSPSRGHPKMKQAAQAAVTAAVVEAFASRNDPGSIFEGERGRRIAEAAIAAGGLDALVDRDPNHHGKRHIAEAVLGGIAGQRALNGPHRSRSRSRSRSGRHHDDSNLGNLAKGGLAVAATKAFLDLRNRSKSRDRDGSRHNRSSSGRRRSSLGGAVEKGLGALGLGALASGEHDKHDKHNGTRRPRSGSRPSIGRRDTGYPRGRARGSSSDSSSDDMSSSDEERTRRKLRGKELTQAGLATIATIHSAHSLYENMKAGRERYRALRDGEITEEQAQRSKAKAAIKELASLGIAAYGVRGTIKSWDTMKSRHREMRDFDDKRAMRRSRRGNRRARSVGDGSEYDTDSWRRSSAASPPNSDRNGGPTTHRDGNPYAAGGLGPRSEERKH